MRNPNLPTKLRVAFLSLVCLGALLPLSAQAAGPSAPKRPKVAVVFSGGSAFGIAHVGVLEEIEAAGIPIDMVVGTSMGSIVGGLYAAGYSPRQMTEILAALDWNSVFSDNRSSAGDRFQRRVRDSYVLRIGLEKQGLDIGEGLIQGQSILAYFTMLTVHCLDLKSFDDFPVPYRAVATDLMTGEKVILGSGSLAEAMRSSMSIPAVFRPYALDGRILVDGGLVDDLPVDVARSMGADIVIAVESRGPDPSGPDALRTPMAIAGQSANLMVLLNLRPSREEADLFIKCDLHGFTTASYNEAARLIERGREAGRSARLALDALAKRIGETRSLVDAASEPNRRALVSPPVLSSIRIDGGTAADADQARKAFAFLVGRPWDRLELKAAIDAVYGTGHFELVRFSVESGEGQKPGTAVGVVSLEPDASSDRAVFAAIGYTGVYSADLSNSFGLGTALFLQDLTGKDSALLVTADFVNALKFGVSYFQPVGPLYLEPWLRYDSEYDSLSFSQADVVIGSKYRSAGAGLWAGLALGKDSDFALGYSWESVLSADFSDTVWRNLSALRAAVYLDGRDASAFPEKGFALIGSGRWAGGFLGGELSFAQLELATDAVFRIGHGNSLALSFFAGTDFSGIVPGAASAPVAFYSKIRHPGMFYGYSASDPDGAGDHAVGLGLEIRHRLAGTNPLLGKFFVFGNASLGSSAVAGDSLASLPFLWCASAGVQVRLTRSFGMMAGASLLRSDTGGVAAALSLELGSFISRPEDRR